MSNSLTPIRSRQNVGPELGPNYLKGLSADDNVMFKFNTKLKYIGSISSFHNLQSFKLFSTLSGPDKFGPDLGPNCLKWLSADDNIT